MSAPGQIARLTRHLRLRSLLLGAVLAFGLCAYASTTSARPVDPDDHLGQVAHARHKPKLLLTVSPGRDTILAGTTAGYRITIRRRRFTGSVRIRVIGGLPPGTNARFAPSVIAGSSSMLTIRTSANTPPGDYTLRLRARHGKVQRTATVMLTIGGPGDAAGATSTALPNFQVTGTVADPLWPGLPGAVDLTITNPNPMSLDVTSLTVSITNISAPRAGPALPCSGADFDVQQYSGPPVVVPPSSTRSLEGLGIPTAAWPQVAIIDTSTDQDGCQGASLTLAYGGQATLG